MTTTTTGTRKRVTATFTLDGTATDPGTVIARVLSPDGDVTTPAAVRLDDGVYFVDVDVSDPGRWTVRFVGSAPVVSATEVTIDVAASPFYPND